MQTADVIFGAFTTFTSSVLVVSISTYCLSQSYHIPWVYPMALRTPSSVRVCVNQ